MRLLSRQAQLHRNSLICGLKSAKNDPDTRSTKPKPGRQRVRSSGSGKTTLPSLRFRLRLRRPHNHGLVVLKRASTEILRASQCFLREFSLAELLVSQEQLIVDISVMVQRSGLLKLGDRIGKLSQAHVRGSQQAAGVSRIRLKPHGALQIREGLFILAILDVEASKEIKRVRARRIQSQGALQFRLRLAV